MELTLEHYIAIGLSLVFGILIAVAFLRATYSKNLAVTEAALKSTQKKAQTLSNDLAAKEIEINSIRKQTVELMKSESDMKAKLTNELSKSKEKELLLKSVETKIIARLNTIPTKGVTQPSSEHSTIDSNIQEVSLNSETLASIHTNVTELKAKTEKQLNQILENQMILEKSTGKHAEEGKSSEKTATKSQEKSSQFDLDAMKVASQSLEDYTFLDGDEFLNVE
ncbi:hypothetical protein OAB00_01760 [Akkermansiaceae bacterium]|nr:hypothetical protein [Akkermansiaceae bacterium]